MVRNLTVLTISVVIPAKDDAVMLARCLEALQRQTRPAHEIIVVDNGSTDETADVARRSGATVLTELRPGITAAASRGYDASKADIIARCDADSVVAPDWLFEIDAAFSEDQHLTAITSGAVFFDLSAIGNWLARVFYLGSYFLAVGAAVANPPLFGSNFAMRASTWRAVSTSVPRDKPDLHDDFDLSYRIRPEERVRVVRSLRVSISGRPFRDAGAFRLRVRRAFVTMAEHLPGELPHLRWWRKLHRRARVR